MLTFIFIGFGAILIVVALIAYTSRDKKNQNVVTAGKVTFTDEMKNRDRKRATGSGDD